jgi:cytoskeletal protein RodZ
MEDNSILGLAKIRRNRGITLEQIAQETKISRRSLEAIECGDFGKLPGGIYTTSYLRQYARAIDFDENTLLDYYYERTGQAPNCADGEQRDQQGAVRGLNPASISNPG